MSKAYIFGNGGHARVIASLIPHEAQFVVPGHEGGINEAEFFERLDDHARNPIFIGIGSNEVRRRIFDRLKAAGVTVATCIAPNAFVARTAVIAVGTSPALDGFYTRTLNLVRLPPDAAGPWRPEPQAVPGAVLSGQALAVV